MSAVERVKKWRKKNPEKLREQRWKWNHSRRGREADARYRDRNLKNRREWERNEYRTNPIFRLRSNLRARIRSALRSKGQRKKYSVERYLGCKLSFFKSYIESQFRASMTWDNHGLVWEIDHIKPVSKFNLKLEEQRKKCFHFSNCQPLLGRENRKKFTTYGTSN